jgi:rod shape-determining protein MreC
VARVTEVFHDPGQPFARVTAEPMAQLQRSRHFLLLFPPPREEVEEHAWDETLDISAEALRSSLQLSTSPNNALRDSNASSQEVP